jgi:hypothetical protein
MQMHDRALQYEMRQEIYEKGPTALPTEREKMFLNCFCHSCEMLRNVLCGNNI